MSDLIVEVMDRALETMERLAGRIVALEARSSEPAQLPPELAEQVSDAIRLLYAPTPFPALPAVQSAAAQRPSRIERDDSGGYALVYDDDAEPQA